MQSGSAQFRTEDIRAGLDAPFTQVNVAVAFLAERGCIVRARGRRYKAASDFVYEDALIEYHALKDPSPHPPGTTGATGESGAGIDAAGGGQAS